MKKIAQLIFYVLILLSCSSPELEKVTIPKAKSDLPDIKAEFVLNPRNFDNLTEVAPKFPYGRYRIPFSKEYVLKHKIKSIKRFYRNESSEFVRFDFDQKGNLTHVQIENDGTDMDNDITYHEYTPNKISYTEKSVFMNYPITSISTYQYDKHGWISSYEIIDPDDANENRYGKDYDWKFGKVLVEKLKDESLSLTFYVHEEFLLEKENEIVRQMNNFMKKALKNNKFFMIDCYFPKINGVELHNGYHWSDQTKKLEKMFSNTEFYDRGIYMGYELFIPARNEIDQTIKIAYDKNYYPCQIKSNTKGFGGITYELKWENNLLKEVNSKSILGGDDSGPIDYNYDFYP